MSAKVIDVSEPTISNRRALANHAMQASITARLRAGMDLVNPACVYAVCSALGVHVTFNKIEMEGMYQRGRPPRIHLSSRRPLGRRNYNCAHELGHHVLGHGSSIDELREDAKTRPWNVPDEFLADTFAGFLLMPTLGIRRSFSKRGWMARTATPAQIFQVACEYSVGYTTLVNHLLYSLEVISRRQADTLLLVKPKRIKSEILGRVTPGHLVIVDRHWSPSTIDVEVGSFILLPPDTFAESPYVELMADIPSGRLYRSIAPGISQVAVGDLAVFVRASRHEYVGRAEYRHLQEEEDE